MAAQAALTYPECRQSCKSSDIDMDEIKEKAKPVKKEAPKKDFVKKENDFHRFSFLETSSYFNISFIPSKFSTK